MSYFHYVLDALELAFVLLCILALINAKTIIYKKKTKKKNKKRCTRKEGEPGKTYHMRHIRWNQLPYNYGTINSELKRLGTRLGLGTRYRG